MFQRGSVRRLQSTVYETYLHHRVRPPWTRSSSSAQSERSRKLPGSDGTSKLKLWQKTLAIGIGAGFVAGQVILYYNGNNAGNSFVAYTLIGKTPVSSTASIFYLEPKTKSANFEKYRAAWRNGVWNVEFKQPQIQIVRAYTPLPPLESHSKDEEDQTLRFLIRHDPYGEVSSYLHRLPIGANIEVRGPNLEYRLVPDVRQVVFFAGGTGIAPALQVAHSMFGQDVENNPSNVTKNRKLHILWASRKREDCLGGISDAPPTEALPPKATWSGLFTKQRAKPVVQVGEEKGIIVQELENLKNKYPGQITVEYFVNAEETWIDEDVVFRSLSRFDDKDFSTGLAASNDQRQILISGPSGFISFLAGPKEWRNGKEEQGPVGKLLAHAMAQNPHHVKVWKI